MSLADMRNNKRHIVLQVAAAMVFMTFVLAMMSVASNSQVSWAIGAGSLGSSTFIVFTIPNSISARSSRVIGGYAVAIVVGILVHVLLSSAFDLLSSHITINNSKVFWVASSVAIGLSMIVMILLDCQHPPAAGVALVLVLDIHEYYTLAVIMITAIMLALIRHYAKPYLVNLSE